MHTAYVTLVHYTSTYATSVILLAAKSEKIFQDAIKHKIKIDLHLLKVALMFCLKYYHFDVLFVFQTNKKVVPCSLLSYTST